MIKKTKLAIFCSLVSLTLVGCQIDPPPSLILVQDQGLEGFKFIGMEKSPESTPLHYLWRFSWDGSPIGNTYTVCQINKSLEDQCDVIATIRDSNHIDLAISPLTVAENEGYFVLASREGQKTVSSQTEHASLNEVTASIIEFLPADLLPKDYFGFAAMSGNGQVIAIGASDVGGAQDQPGPGAVYMYTFTQQNGWQQSAIVTATNGENGDEFGYALSLSDDGSTLVVSSRSKEAKKGAAYLFTRTNNDWVQQSILVATNGKAGDRFGQNLTVSGDGATVAVSAPSESSASVNTPEDISLPASGAIYIFEKESNWAQTDYIKASNPFEMAQFGSDIDLDKKGKVLIVGALQEKSDGLGNDNLPASGAAYILTKTPSGWREDKLLKADNLQIAAQFGNAVSINDAGNRILVGAFTEASDPNGILDPNQYNQAGAAYIFDLVGGSWDQTAFLKASNAEMNDHFGWSAKISGDGETLIIGALKEDSNGTGINSDTQNNNDLSRAGAVYKFKLENEIWTQKGYLKAPTQVGAKDFGRNLAINFDGKAVLLSGYKNSAGIVYMY